MKIFKQRPAQVDGQGNAIKPQHDTQMVGGNEHLNLDATFAMDVTPANLSHHGMPYNKFSSKIFATTVNVWNDRLHWRPTIRTQSFLRVRNTTTGALNPSTNNIDLDNGTGAAGAGDVFIITWLQDGSVNDNVEEFVVWLGASAADGNSANSFVRMALFDITALALVAPPALDALGAGVGAVPFNLDHLFYDAASQVAFAQVAFNNVPLDANGGGPVRFQLCYNAREVRAPALIDGHTYAVAIYLLVGGVDNTNHIHIYGSDVAADDPNSVTYVGVAGWNGALGVDNTVHAAYYEILKTDACVVNQIEIIADATQSLGDAIIEKIVVEPDADAGVRNIQTHNITAVTKPDEYYNIEAVSLSKVGDAVSQLIVFEGKIIVPRRHFLKIVAYIPYTGDVTIKCNFWAETRGNALGIGAT